MFKQFIQKALPLLAFLACLHRAAAQEKLSDFKPQFEHFVLPGDMTANSVQHIVQDSLGYLWFASEGGLHRYDGRSIVTHKFDPLTENCISDDYVEWIYIDRKGKMWLGHYGGGLTSFDRSTGTFKRFRHNPADPQSLSNDWVSMILEDRQGFLWIATHDGLNRLDPQTGKFKRFYHDPQNPRSLSHNLVRSLYLDSRGTLWLGCGFPWLDNGDTGGGLNRYDPKTESFTNYLHQPGNPNSLSDNRVRTIFEDSKGNFWIGTMGDGLHLMNRGKGTFTRLRSRKDDVPAKPFLKDFPRNTFGQVTFVFEDNRGWLWIGSFDGGVNVFDPKTKEMKHFEADFERKGALQNNFIWNICQTKDGTIWLSSGTGGRMVFKIKTAPKVAVFQEVKLLEAPKISVRAIAEDLTGKLWLGTSGGGGLVSLDPKTGKTSRFSSEPNLDNQQNGNLKSEGINSVAADKKGSLWVGGDNGLKKIDPKSGKTERILPALLEGQVPVGKTLEDRQGNIWIATYGEGIVRYDPATGKHQRFNTSNGLGGNFVLSLLEDRFGNIWAGGGKPDKIRSEPLFLARFDTIAQIFKNFQFAPPGEIGSVVQMAEDEEGYLWFTTALNGIRRLDPATGSIKKYTVSNSSIPSNDIRSLVATPGGKIWMSAKVGLIEFDPAAETFYPYSSQHGVTAASMIYAATLLRRNGEVLFGSYGGFHKVISEKIKPTQASFRSEPVVAITGFSLMNQPAEPGNGGVAIWQQKEIRLPFDHHLFAFTVACFDFNLPDANRLEYMLENYDASWRTDLKDGQATYVNVPPGTYIFKVRGANSEGVWNTLGSEIRVVILPPWWKTWWACSLWVLLVVSALYFGYKFQMNRRLAQAETERLRALDAAKSKLYTNITHEFRTPLTIILGMAKQVKENPGDWFRPGLDMIERNGQNLLQLVNQLLDLAKLEDGKMSLNLVRSDVVSHLKYLVESFHSFAESKKIRLHFLSDLEALTMDFDAEKLQQVVSNLLSNAVKFTPEGGDIYVQIGMRYEGRGMKNDAVSSLIPHSSSLILKVRDTGIGIPEAQLPHIFDRFFQVDDSATRQSEGSGIGLALTKELVRLMGGEIAVKSIPIAIGRTHGTEFQLSLPVKTEAAARMPNLGGNFKLPPKLDAGRPAPIQPIIAEKPLIPSYIASPQQSAINNQQSTILLIEDNPDVVAYLAACLQNDYRLAVAKDGREGIEIATEIIPDLIVSDVMMPHKDGFEVCRFLKNDERTSHIPIILLTAKADQPSLLEGLETGADAYLAKPFHKEELQLRIRKLLELRETLQRRYRSSAGLTEAPPLGKEVPETAPVEDYFLKKVRRAVEAHLEDCDFTVEELCREIGMSNSQLHRKLSALTGCSATKFIRRLRLQKAKELLQNEALSVTSIAFDAGFNDPSYFSRVFKQEFGLTPAEWRDRQMLLADS